MSTLEAAYWRMNAKLDPKYIYNNYPEIKGKLLIKFVGSIEKHLENIGKAIEALGKDYPIPCHDHETPDAHAELFKGCVEWRRRLP